MYSQYYRLEQVTISSVDIGMYVFRGFTLSPYIYLHARKNISTRKEETISPPKYYFLIQNRYNLRQSKISQKPKNKIHEKLHFCQIHKKIISSKQLPIEIIFLLFDALMCLVLEYIKILRPPAARPGQKCFFTNFREIFAKICVLKRE